MTNDSPTMPGMDIFDLFAFIDPEAVDEVAQLMDQQMAATGALMLMLPRDPEILH